MLGQNIERLIRERKESKVKVAKLIDVTRATLDNYLSGATFMPSDKIETIARHFGVNVGYLFGETDDFDSSVRKLLLDQQQQINDINRQLKVLSDKIVQ